MAAKAVNTRAKGLAMPAAELALSGVVVAEVVAFLDAVGDDLAVDSVRVDEAVRVMFIFVMVELVWGTGMMVVLAVMVELVMVELTEAADMYEGTCEEMCDETDALTDEADELMDETTDEAEELKDDAIDETVEAEAAAPTTVNLGEKLTWLP